MAHKQSSTRCESDPSASLCLFSDDVPHEVCAFPHDAFHEIELDDVLASAAKLTITAACIPSTALLFFFR